MADPEWLGPLKTTLNISDGEITEPSNWETVRSEYLAHLLFEYGELDDSELNPDITSLMAEAIEYLNLEPDQRDDSDRKNLIRESTELAAQSRRINRLTAQTAATIAKYSMRVYPEQVSSATLAATRLYPMADQPGKLDDYKTYFLGLLV